MRQATKLDPLQTTRTQIGFSMSLLRIASPGESANTPPNMSMPEDGPGRIAELKALFDLITPTSCLQNPRVRDTATPRKQ